MEKILVVKYKCECGRKYATKSTAVNHERVCQCWTNPKHKTCKTCVFGKHEKDSNGMEHEPNNLQTWKQWNCYHPKANDGYSKAAHKEITDLRVECFLHQTKH